MHQRKPSVLGGRSSKFTSIQGKRWDKRNTHENLKVGQGHKLNALLKTNGSLFAIPYETNGGVVAFHGVEDFIRWNSDQSTKEYPSLVHAHPKPISDFEFCPHVTHGDLLATTSADETVKLWDLKIEQKEITVPKIELKQEVAMGVINSVRFHPLVESMLYTCQNNQLHFWDYSVGKKLFSFDHSASGQCLSTDWCINYADGVGDILLTGSTDKMARVWDIRQGCKKIAEMEAHASLKPYTVMSIGRGSSVIFSVGFSKSGQREFVMWDRRDVTKTLERLTIDNGAAIMNPFYDSDIHVLYLAGKGDGNIRYYEIDDSNAKLNYLNEFQSEQPQAGVAMLPKRCVDVNKFELARFLKLTPDNTVYPISFSVLRKDNIEGYFQEDIYPDTWDQKPTISVEQYLDTKIPNEKLKLPIRVSLKPADKISIFDVPEEQGGKKRPVLDISLMSLTTPTASPPTARATGTALDINTLDPSSVRSTSSAPVGTKSAPTTVAPVQSGWPALLGRFFINFGFYAWVALRFILWTGPVKIYRIWRPAPVVPGEVKKVPVTTVIESTDEKTISAVLETIPVTQVTYDKKTGDVTISEQIGSKDAQIEACQPLLKHLIIKPEDFKKRAHEKDPDLKAVEVDLIDVKKGRLPMLMRVKGRRLTRLIWVPCHWSSLNAHDSFVLDMGNKIYQYNGKHVNRMCAAKALDVCSTIKFKERGGEAQVLLLNQEKEPERAEEKKLAPMFWKTIGVADEKEYLQKSGNDKVGKTDVEIAEDAFAPIVDRSQFLYQVNSDIFDQIVKGEEESEEDFIARIKPHLLLMINLQPNVETPIQPSHHVLQSKYCYVFEAVYSHEVFVWTGKQSTTQTRSWALIIGRALAAYRTSTLGEKKVCFTRIIDGGENTIYKNKFSDYPGETMINTGVIETKGNIAEKKVQAKIDVGTLFKGSVVGLSILKKLKESIVPFSELRLQIWVLENNERVPIPKDSYGNFNSSDNYIIQHTYNKIKGGKDLFVLYFWQGRDSKKKDRGTVALQTIEVNKDLSLQGDTGMVEHQVRVEQSKEPAEFLNLFNGHYVVHQKDDQGWKLYDVRDGIAVACEKQFSNISQYSCHLLVNDEKVILWQGKRADAEQRRMANGTTKNMFKDKELTILEEGQNDEIFLEQISGKRSDKVIFPDVPEERKPRLYIADEATGVNTLTEDILSQENLESEKCFLIDASGRNQVMYVWIGRAASPALKKFILETCVDYSQVSKPKEQLVVNENYEPKELTIQFQSWSTQTTAYKSRKSAAKGEEPKNAAKITTVEAQLEILKPKIYAYSVLTDGLAKGTLPEGVDSTILETYLSDEEFEKVFKMNRQAWIKVAAWQKTKKKKEAMLF